MRVTVHSGVAGLRERSIPAKIFATLFFAVFLAVGSWMTWLMVRGLFHTAGRYRWEPVACTFTTSDWSEDPAASGSGRYAATTSYRYTWSGSEYRGEASEGFSSVGDAQRFRDQHAPGTEGGCFVNPEAPHESALRRPSPWAFLAVLFPMVFVAAGGIPIFLMWRPRRPEPAETPRPVALTGKKENTLLTGCIMVGFFGVFFLAGAAILWFLLGRPLVRISQARAWPEIPCTVVSSEVVTHPGDDGATYSALVRYRYRAGGREYESDRYDFSTGSTSGSERYQAIVDRFAAGSSCVCFVDPGDPTRAVLDRGFQKSYWFGLAGLPFFAVGAGGLFFLARAGVKRGSPARASAAVRSRELPSPPLGPIRLRPKTGPWKKLFGALAVNFFWNGIVGVFIFVIARDWRAGNHAWMPILILVPFALIGLLLLSGLPYAFLALFNPRPFLELERAECAPGESVGATFRLSGLLGRMDRLEVALEGKEAITVTSRSGGKSSTSRRDKMFHRSLVYESGPGATVERQAAITVRVPADTMHTFSSDRAEVLWRLHVRGEIRNWPDIDEEFELQVPPRRGLR